MWGSTAHPIPALLLVALLNFLLISVSPQSFGEEEPFVPGFVNPCVVARERRHPRHVPLIRVVDEATGDSPDILLGIGGHPFYSVPQPTPTDVVIECSSPLGRVRWGYKGRGATSGVKVAQILHTAPNKLKPICFSAALVISNVTDQLTGEFSCYVEKIGKKAKDEEVPVNSFVLYVPHVTPFYYKEGESFRTTVPAWSGSAGEPVTLPCISKRRAGAGISLYQVDDGESNGTMTLRKMELGRHLKYGHFTGFMLTPTEDLFQGRKEVKLVCKFDRDLKNFTGIANRTLLEITLALSSVEKFAPDSSAARAFSPYFSWTMRDRPRIEIVRNNNSDASVESTVEPVIWQQFYTKNGFEEWNRSAPIFHLGSLHLLRGSEGEEGTVRLLNDNDDIAVREWDYFVFEHGNEDIVGFSYDPVDHFHVFTCVAASSSRPNVTFKPLLSDETEFYNVHFGTKDRVVEEYTLSDCPEKPEGNLGCVILTTSIPQGEVTCAGDGVQRTIRYPSGYSEPSRPFFVERGQTVYIYTDDEEVATLPCLPNTPEAQYFANLFKRNGSNYTAMWSHDREMEGVEFHPNWGFHIDTSVVKDSPEGEYLCSSSSDPADPSDTVTVVVKKQGFSVSPKESEINGSLPYAFRWAWSTSSFDVDVQEESLRPLVKVEREGAERWKKAELLLNRTQLLALNSSELNLTLINRKDENKVLHQWSFRTIESAENAKPGLVLKHKTVHVPDKDGGVDHSVIYMACRGAPTEIDRDVPVLNYYFCQNPNTCELVRKCNDKDCNADFKYEWEEIPPEVLKAEEPCRAEEGCVQRVLKSVPLNGYLRVYCKYNGITEERNISDVFFREDIHWPVQSNSDLLFLYVNTPHDSSVDQNPEREVRDIASNLEWSIGDTVQFSCAGAVSNFSGGVRWGLENKDGDILIQKTNIYDPQWKYSGLPQILSSFTLPIDSDSFDLKRVWCFAPTWTDPVKWMNSSQPIFVKHEINDNCRETDPSIRLINVYPPASRINLDINGTRIDKKYFVAPEGLLQFGIEINTPEPVVWSFVSALGNEHSLSGVPMIETERHATNFYDPSTYCYTSKMLVNLRKRNISDTGRFFARFAHHPETVLDFYLFAPNGSHPYLLRSGETIEMKVRTGQEVTVPCLLNNPYRTIELFKMNESTPESSEVEDFYEVEHAEYDPTKGFTLRSKGNASEIAGTYKCIVENNLDDILTVVVSVKPEHADNHKERFGLSHKKVANLNVFTCVSNGTIKPNVTFSSVEYQLRDCNDPTGYGCVLLTTRKDQGTAVCTWGSGNSTLELPLNNEEISHSGGNDEKYGIAYDPESSVFRCRANETNEPTLYGVRCRRPNECDIMINFFSTQDFVNDEHQVVSSCGEGCTQVRVRERIRSDWSPFWFKLQIWCGNYYEEFFHYKGQVERSTPDNHPTYKEVRMDIVSFQKRDGEVQGKFRCFANRYFHSRGILWALQKKDGTFSFQSSQDHLSTQAEVQSFNDIMSEIRLEFDESLYKGLWCFAPAIDSPKWSNQTLPFPITKLVYSL